MRKNTDLNRTKINQHKAVFFNRLNYVNRLFIALSTDHLNLFH